ncbi:NAD(P)H-dependent oxidoreductase [Saccharophagus degradans]|uniref:FMN-dependent NADH-azoreductase n=1 Tax=Saccharophagus degradans TaxID=86304 RepID=UPI0024780C05|nr:NAD(P)H-dependent oxidoreductase [Saccharophagus degradans]WGO98817.1 NAD(P)H-dependent oxidoreductase [Saccharophagus degradans]
MTTESQSAVKNILHVESSLFGEGGVSSQLSTELVAKLQNKYADVNASVNTGVNTGVNIVKRNLAADPIPHLDLATITAIGEGKPVIGDTLIQELKNADILVLGVPMYNFGVPSGLKAWFDHIARAGSTFKYTETGPVGLLENKKVYVVTSRGGYHKDAASDVEVPFLKTFLGFLGLNDVEFIYAEGLNLSGKRKQGLADASAKIAALVGEEAA